MIAPLLQTAAPRFGRLLGARKAGPFEFRLSRYAGANTLPPHRHPHAYFCYVVDGAIDERSGGRDRRYVSGSLHFHPAGDPHSARTGHEGLVSLSVVTPRTGDGGAARTARLLREGAPPPLGTLAARCYAAFLAADPAGDLALESAATELLAAALGEPGSADDLRPRWIAAVRDHLHGHVAARVTLAELAGVAGVHEVHVVRGFRRALGVTPGAYLRRLRLDAARRALLETDRPLVDIAGEAGFYDQAHFTRAFRGTTGLSPARFRRLHAALRR